MELYLLRHGIAEDHASTGRDSDRRLTEYAGTSRETATAARKAAPNAFMKKLWQNAREKIPFVDYGTRP